MGRTGIAAAASVWMSISVKMCPERASTRLLCTKHIVWEEGPKEGCADMKRSDHKGMENRACGPMLPPRTESLIRGFAEQSKTILRDNLTGIYLHGSAVMGCFNPQKSDIDLIIEAEEPLADPVKRACLDMTVRHSAMGPAKGIEMSVVLRRVCRPFVYPTPYELHFSVGHLEWYKNDPDDYIRRMNGTDKDLAAHFTIINKRGRCVCGAPIGDVFASVPACDYMDSIWNDIADAEENITDDTMYLTLNLARVLAFKETGAVLSKKEGGEWALGHLPVEYHPLIMGAMREYTENAEISYDAVLAKRYADYMMKRIRR